MADIAMKDSILLSTRKMIGGHVTNDETIFDMDYIFHINSIFSNLFQMGIGPKDEPFEVTDIYDSWDEFTDDKKELNSAKTYMYICVKLIFDPPNNATLLEHFKKEKDEFEWRMNISDDTGE